MANFGHHLSYPTPDWVAYRREEEIARARAERRPDRPSLLAHVASALRRLTRAWVKAHATNAYL